MGIRDFIEGLERIGRLRRVSRPVSCVHELGAMARAARCPILFENVKEYPAKSVLVNGLADYRCMALALGYHDTGVNFRQLVRAVRERRKQVLRPATARGPCGNMVVRTGSRCDLAELPAPWWHPADGGRYVGTWHLNVTRHPTTGEPNAGVYRMQVIDRNHTTVSVSPRSHLASHMRVAEAQNEPLPMAVAIGVPEAAVIAASAAVEAGVDELAFAGTLLGHALDVVPCAAVGLQVPRSAEIVLEGMLLPHVRVSDGPFMDYAGVADTNPRALLFEVHRIALRADAVFRGASVGLPGAEDHVLFSVLAAAGLADFHGARSRHLIQTFLLRNRFFRLMQMSGRVSQRMPRPHRKAPHAHNS
ncbi:MAG: hypothetical protein GF331_25600 [Chitinivibrionales bacterium]|nr:hypothetical protein [Chitinivibrionales bacterium]